MKSARLVLEGRQRPWALVIEPWALALDVPVGLHVFVEVFDDEDPLHVEISRSGTFLAFESPKFQIRIGDTLHDYNFGARPSGMFDNLWPSSTT